MSMQRILIVEDEAEEAAFLQEILSGQYNIVGVAENADKAYKLYTETRPHICIVDIYLNNQPDGVAFVQKLNNDNEDVVILFLTGNYDNVVFYLAKTTNPHSYLLKPYNPIELQYAIELSLQKIQGRNIDKADTLFIKRGNVMARINIHDIKYIEVDGKYSKLICKGERFLVQQSLKELQSKLPASLFSRIHRNYIVNIEEVVKIDVISHEVFFKDGTSLYFSRRYFDDLLEYFKVLK